MELFVFQNRLLNGSFHLRYKTSVLKCTTFFCSYSANKVKLIDQSVYKNTGKYGSEKTPYFDTFHAATITNGKQKMILKQ